VTAQYRYDCLDGKAPSHFKGGLTKSELIGIPYDFSSRYTASVKDGLTLVKGIYQSVYIDMFLGFLFTISSALNFRKIAKDNQEKQ
jgi:hypothetical protein